MPLITIIAHCQLIVATHTMVDSKNSVCCKCVHASFVWYILFQFVYVLLHVCCPHLHTFSSISLPYTPSFMPPASFHPRLDRLHAIFLASLHSHRRFALSTASAPFFSRHRSAFLISLCLLLCGDVELNPGPSSPTQISLATLNIRSATSVTPSLHKPEVLQDFILHNSLEILTLTETWLSTDSPTMALNSLTPPNFHLIHKPRLTGRGGGLAVIYRSYLKVTERTIPHFESFESLFFQLNLSGQTLSFLLVYRPHSTSLSTFCTEFSHLLADLCSRPSELFILGDFNIHVDDPTAPGTNSFLSSLHSFDLKQHVNFSTHESGHTLDLLISHTSSASLSNISPYFPALSDHDAVLATLSVPVKDRPTRITKTIRSIRSINPAQFSNDIRSSALFKTRPTSLAEYLQDFNSTLISLMEKHTPARVISCCSRPSQPFFTP